MAREKNTIGIARTGEAPMETSSVLARGGKLARRLAVSALTDWKWRDRTLNPVWVGSHEGGAWLDIGLLNASSVVYSFGIACEISFDRDTIARVGCQVAGFDPDPAAGDWLKGGVWVPPGFEFTQVGLFSESGPRTFFQADPEAMTGSVLRGSGEESMMCEFLTLEDIMRRRGDVFIDAVKMDIEGAEYAVFGDWLSRGFTPPVGQIWVEFHPWIAGFSRCTTQDFVRDLESIGLHAAKHAHWRRPDGFLLVNKDMRRDDAD